MDFKIYKNCAGCLVLNPSDGHNCEIGIRQEKTTPKKWSTHISGYNQEIVDVKPAVPCPKPYNSKKYKQLMDEHNWPSSEFQKFVSELNAGRKN